MSFGSSTALLFKINLVNVFSVTTGGETFWTIFKRLVWKVVPHRNFQKYSAVLDSAMIRRH